MIRLAKYDDLPRLMEVFHAAQKFMASHGNASQWGDAYPPEDLIRQDIELSRIYCIVRNGCVRGAFVLMESPEPTYRVIENGEWISDSPYLVIHRIASDGTEKGIFDECMSYCKTQSDHLRIDTHADNTIMQHLITKNGFLHCGTIFVRGGLPRIAYEYCASKP